MNSRRTGNQAAFTLIEIVAVCAIVAVLSGLMAPVLARAIHASKESNATNKLHNLQLAFALYRTTHDGDGVYGRPSAMGLPDYDHFYQQGYLSVSNKQDLWNPSCGVHPEMHTARVKYDYTASGREGEPWIDYVLEKQEEAVLLRDRNCTDHSVPLNADYFPRVVIAVRLNGQALKKVVFGYASALSIWHR